MLQFSSYLYVIFVSVKPLIAMRNELNEFVMQLSVKFLCDTMTQV